MAKGHDKDDWATRPETIAYFAQRDKEAGQKRAMAQRRPDLELAALEESKKAEAEALEERRIQAMERWLESPEGLAEIARVTGAEESESEKQTSTRFAGDAVRQHAVAGNSLGIKWPLIDEARKLSNGSELVVFNRNGRQLDFTPIDRPGSLAGTVEGLRRIPGRHGLPAMGNGRDFGATPGNVLYSPEDVVDLYTPRNEFTEDPELLARLGIESLQNKIQDPRALKRGMGGLTSRMGQLIADYRYGGLHASERERENQRWALESYYRLAQDKQVPEVALANAPVIYRGDVVPVEAIARQEWGAPMALSQKHTGVGSFSVEPYQAYRYAMMKKDGRLDRALSDSPSGLAVRRIAEIVPSRDTLLPIVNGDPDFQGRSEVLHPLVSAGLRLLDQHQIYNASEPEIPLIWQTYGEMM